MAVYELKNDVISVLIDSVGAELKSLKRLSDGREYLWCGDAAYWGRTSPVLFPFGGREKQRVQGKGQNLVHDPAWFCPGYGVWAALSGGE